MSKSGIESVTAKKSQLNLQSSISWKVFLFPSLLKLSSVSNKTQQYFGLDLVDDQTERTIWTHKASIWKGLFESVHELAQAGQVAAISKMLNEILACPVRAVPNGPNETQTFRSAKGQNIQHWIMLVPMPGDVDQLHIPQFLYMF